MEPFTVGPWLRDKKPTSQWQCLLRRNRRICPSAKGRCRHRELSNKRRRIPRAAPIIRFALLSEAVLEKVRYSMPMAEKTGLHSAIRETVNPHDGRALDVIGKLRQLSVQEDDSPPQVCPSIVRTWRDSQIFLWENADCFICA